MANDIRRRVDRLEQANNPPGTSIVEGVVMDVPQMIGFFRRRVIAEADRRRVEVRAGEQRTG